MGNVRASVGLNTVRTFAIRPVAELSNISVHENFNACTRAEWLAFYDAETKPPKPCNRRNHDETQASPCTTDASPQNRGGDQTIIASLVRWHLILTENGTQSYIIDWKNCIYTLQVFACSVCTGMPLDLFLPWSNRHVSSIGFSTSWFRMYILL